MRPPDQRRPRRPWSSTIATTPRCRTPAPTASRACWRRVDADHHGGARASPHPARPRSSGASWFRWLSAAPPDPRGPWLRSSARMALRGRSRRAGQSEPGHGHHDEQGRDGRADSRRCRPRPRARVHPARDARCPAHRHRHHRQQGPARPVAFHPLRRRGRRGPRLAAVQARQPRGEARRTVVEVARRQDRRRRASA